MSLTLDAVTHNRLSPSLRRGAREGDLRIVILTSHGGRRQPWKFCMRGAADWMYTSPPSRPVFDSAIRQPLRHICRFGCTTRELRKLVVWLHEFGVEYVAMESTGVYWKAVWNVLESHFQIVLANAQHIKEVFGLTIPASTVGALVAHTMPSKPATRTLEEDARAARPVDSRTPRAPSLSRGSLRRLSSEIRTGCAKKRPTGSVRGGTAQAVSLPAR